MGGAATRDYAVAEGVQFLLITSSRESVEASIQQAIEQHHLINDVLDKNRLFQSVIDKSGSAVFIFEGTAGAPVYECSGAKNAERRGADGAVPLPGDLHAAGYRDTAPNQKS